MNEMMSQEQLIREDTVRVYIDVDLVRRWFESERSPGDRPGKKHLVIFRDKDGNVVDHEWMTSEEHMKMRLERKFKRRE